MPKPDVSDVRKPEILRAATKLFSEKGIHGASMNDISKAAGLSKATVYYYFDSKEALISALLSELFEKDEPALEELRGSKAPALKSLEDYTQNLCVLLEEHKDHLPIYAEFKALSARNPKVREDLEPCFQAYVELFTEVFERGAKNKEIRKDVDSATAAWRLTALIEGGMTLQNTGSRSFKDIMEPCFTQFFQTLKA